MSEPEADASVSYDLHRLAIQEAIRSIQEQNDEASRIRDRLVTLVGLIATASAFLVGAALRGSARGAKFFVPLLGGTGSFLALLVICLLALKPTKSWRSALNPIILIEDYDDGLRGWKALVAAYHSAFERNEVHLNRLRVQFQLAIVAVGLILTFWILLVWLVRA